MQIVERVKEYVQQTDLLRRSVTVPLKVLLVVGVLVLVVNAAFLVSVKTQRMASKYIGNDVVASAADVAKMRALVEENGALIRALTEQQRQELAATRATCKPASPPPKVITK